MSALAFEIAVLFAMVLANGVFAMTEIAMVSVRKERLRQRAEKGDARAAAALDLAESPNRFLSTVQMGITLIGIGAGAYGAATLAKPLAASLKQVGPIAAYADPLAIGLMTILLGYFSLVLGELVPKRIGLAHAEGIATTMARFMNGLSKVASPIIAFLGWSTDWLLRLLGLGARPDPGISEDEVRGLMQEGLRAGAFNKVESHIVSNALELDQLTVRDLMTPQPKIIWINEAEPHDAIWHKIVVSGHSHFPVYCQSRDKIVGLISVKSIYANLAAGVPARTRDLMTKPLIVPATQSAIALLETFKQSGKHVALAADEFGSIVGMVTLHDVMEALVGEFASVEERARPQIKARPDGSWLVDAMIDIESVEAALPGFRPSEGGNKDFQTLAGFIMKRLGRIPVEGELVSSDGYVFEVLDMDGHRIDKVIVTRPLVPSGPTSASG